MCASSSMQFVRFDVQRHSLSEFPELDLLLSLSVSRYMILLIIYAGTYTHGIAV